MLRQDFINDKMIQKINNFWKWFSDNELAITKAFLRGENREEVLFHIDRNLGYISKRINYVINYETESPKQFKIIFTANGYRKLFGKVTVLEHQAPKLKSWSVQAFIKPVKNLEQFKNGTDKSIPFSNFKLRISEMYFSLCDYNAVSRKISIAVYVKDYNLIDDLSFVEIAVFFVVRNLVGEIACRRNLNIVECRQLPDDTKKLIPMFELQGFLNNINKINNRFKLDSE